MCDDGPCASFFSPACVAGFWRELLAELAQLVPASAAAAEKWPVVLQAPMMALYVVRAALIYLLVWLPLLVVFSVISLSGYAAVKLLGFLWPFLLAWFLWWALRDVFGPRRPAQLPAELYKESEQQSAA